MTEVATQTGIELNARAIAKYVGLDPNDARSHAVVAVCQRYGLDPVLKHVLVIPKGGVYITRDGYLHVAHRSGQLDGIVVEDTGTENGEHWARVTVHRKDMSHGFTFKGRYPVNGPNRQYGPEMAIKNAEVQALRRAFDVAGLPAADEQLPAASVDTSHLLPADAAIPVDHETGEVHGADVVEQESP